MSLSAQQLREKIQSKRLASSEQYEQKVAPIALNPDKALEVLAERNSKIIASPSPRDSRSIINAAMEQAGRDSYVRQLGLKFGGVQSFAVGLIGEDTAGPQGFAAPATPQSVMAKRQVTVS